MRHLTARSANLKRASAPPAATPGGGQRSSCSSAHSVRVLRAPARAAPQARRRPPAGAARRAAHARVHPEPPGALPDELGSIG